MPVLIEIVLWSAKYDPKTAAPKEFVTEARNDREGLIKRVSANLERRTLSRHKK